MRKISIFKMSSNGATKISERLETVSVEVEWSESTLRSQPEDESIESVQRETICDSNAVDVTLHLREVNHLFLLLKSTLIPDKH